MRWLVSLVLLLSACTRALDTPIDQVSCETFTDEESCLAAGCGVGSECGCPYYGSGFPGCYSKQGITSCPAGCGLASCEALTDPVECSNRPDCYALLTYDEPCNSSGCESHFASCEAGPALCDQAPCPDTGGNFGCDGNTSYVFAEGGCAIGCVDTSKCAATE